MRGRPSLAPTRFHPIRDTVVLRPPTPRRAARTRTAFSRSARAYSGGLCRGMCCVDRPGVRAPPADVGTMLSCGGHYSRHPSAFRPAEQPGPGWMEIPCRTKGYFFERSNLYASTYLLACWRVPRAEKATVAANDSTDLGTPWSCGGHCLPSPRLIPPLRTIQSTEQDPRLLI